MLGLRILNRASAVFLENLKVAALLGLPFSAVVTIGTYFDAIIAQSPELHQWAWNDEAVSYTAPMNVVLVLWLVVVILGTFVMTISWTRYILTGATLAQSLHKLPLWRYIKRQLLVAVISILIVIPFVAIPYALQGALGTDAFVLFGLFNDYLSPLAFTLAASVLGISLPGIAIGDEAPFRPSLRYGRRQIAQIVLAITPLYAVYALFIGLIGLDVENTSWAATPSLLLLRIAGGTLVEWVYWMISIAVIAGFYRDMTQREDVAEVFA